MKIAQNRSYQSLQMMKKNHNKTAFKINLKSNILNYIIFINLNIVKVLKG